MASPDSSDDLTREQQGAAASEPEPQPTAEELEAAAAPEAPESPDAPEVPEESAADLFAVASQAASLRRGYKPPPPVVNVKSRRMLIRSVYALGAAMLIPALWATALLIGLSVPMSTRSNSSSMAKVMLLAWPLAVILFAFAGWLNWDLKRIEARRAKRAKR